MPWFAMALQLTVVLLSGERFDPRMERHGWFGAVALAVAACGYSTCRQFCVQEGPQIIYSLSFCNNSGKYGTKSNAWSLNSRRNSTNLQMTGQMLKWSLTALWFSCAVRRRLNWSGHWRLCCLHKVHKIGKIHWSRSIGLFSSLSMFKRHIHSIPSIPVFSCFFYDPNESLGCRSAERSQPDLWCRTSRWWYYNSDCTWAWTSDGILSQGSCGCKSMARYAGRIIFRKFFSHNFREDLQLYGNTMWIFQLIKM